LVLITQWAWLRPYGLGKLSQHLGIQFVRLGQSPDGLGEVADLTRVHPLDKLADPFRRVGMYPVQAVRTDSYIERTQSDIHTDIPLAHPSLPTVCSWLGPAFLL